MAKGGIDISEYRHGMFRVRVFRNHTRYYLGMFPSYEDALAAREQFLEKTNNGALIEPEKYTKSWYEQQAEKQRIDFITRYR